MWQVDIAVNTAKALVPFQDELRALKRRLRPYRGNAANCRHALAQGLDQIETLRRLGLDLRGIEVLDLGSGWNPVVPLLFRAAGAIRVHLTDMERLLDPGTLAQAAQVILANAAEVEARIGVTGAQLAALLAVPAGAALPACLDRLGLTYTVPFDAARTRLKADLIISRTVLEHIPRAVLGGLLRDFRAILRPGGTMFHVIDNTDHREFHDKSLSRIDFLRYPERLWTLFCINPQDYTNRLRHSDYLGLFRDAGYDIVMDEREILPAVLHDARTLKLWGRFARMAPDDVATVTSHIVARRRPGDNEAGAGDPRPQASR